MDENQACPCKKIKCEWHSNCVLCREHHNTVETRYLPACDRLRAKKKTKKKSRIFCSAGAVIGRPND